MLAFFVAYALATMTTYRWRARLNLSVLDDLPRLVVSVAAAAGIAYWVAAGIGHWAASGEWNAPRPRPIALAVGAALLAIVRGQGRVVPRWSGWCVRPSRQGEAAVVLGTGRDADFLIDRIQTHREYGLRLAGQVEPRLVEGDGFASRRYALERSLAEHPTMRTLLVTEGATPGHRAHAADAGGRRPRVPRLLRAALRRAEPVPPERRGDLGSAAALGLRPGRHHPAGAQADARRAGLRHGRRCCWLPCCS